LAFVWDAQALAIEAVKSVPAWWPAAGEPGPRGRV